LQPEFCSIGYRRRVGTLAHLEAAFAMNQLNTPQCICNFGLARCDITPPVGIYHRAWGAATHERATGVHRPLTAAALVFQASDGPQADEPEQVLIAIDHCLLGFGEMNALADRICRGTGLAADQLVVTFSHTHAAGLMGLDRIHFPGGELIPPYLDELAGRLTRIVGEARQAAQPVTITYGLGRCPLAANRDYWDETIGQFTCGFNPDGPADDTVQLARVTDSAGKLVAVLVNYACHPTTLAWQNTLISPDFPGAMCALIEGATGSPCVFLQGASGDLGPREGFVGDPAVADRNGRQLGYAVLAALEGLPPPATSFVYGGPVVSGATLGTWAHMPIGADAVWRHARFRWRRWTVDLPYRPELPSLEGTRVERERWLAEERAALQAGDITKARDCHALAERMTRWLARLPVLPPGPTFPFPVMLGQMGDAFWLALEGEHYSLLQRELRQRFTGVPIMIITLANGARPTYLPASNAYGKGIYQESIAVLAQGCLEQLIEAIAAKMHALVGVDG
jgi:hypothetical protein